MAKVCLHEGCMNNVFSDGRCKFHLYESDKFLKKQKVRNDKMKEKYNHIPKRINRSVALGRSNCSAKQKKIEKVKKVPVVELNYELNILVGRCDHLVSRLVRQMYANNDGIVRCYTCNNSNHWREMDCGHYISRRYFAFRWDYKNNLRPQCKNCNQFMDGNMVEFSMRLMKENPAGVEVMLMQKNSVFKITRNYLISLKKELKDELTKRGFLFRR